MQRRSYGTVSVAFLNRARAIEELRARAERLCQRDARVRLVGLFGSLARGDATPSSDADVLIVLSDHPLTRWFDRIPEYGEAFTGTSLPVEPFVYTWDEVARLLASRTILRTAVGELVLLVGDASILYPNDNAD